MSEETYDGNMDLIESFLAKSKQREEFQLDKEQRPKYFNFDSPGIYNFRVIFAGNTEENLPFKSYEKHSYYDPTSKASYKYRDTICWDWLTKQRSLVAFLAERGRIAKQDLQQYDQGGCPFCNTYKVLLNGGVPKETLGRMKKEIRYLFNFYFLGKDLKNGGMDSDKEGFYVWETGQSNFEKVIGPWKDAKIKRNYDMMDLNKGHDLCIQASGTGNLRRYAPYWSPSPSPFAKELDIKEYSQLLLIKFLPYQNAIDRIKNEHNVTLIKMEYTIPGDLGTPVNSLADQVFPSKAKAGFVPDDEIPF